MFLSGIYAMFNTILKMEKKSFFSVRNSYLLSKSRVLSTEILGLTKSWLTLHSALFTLCTLFTLTLHTHNALCTFHSAHWICTVHTHTSLSTLHTVHTAQCTLNTENAHCYLAGSPPEALPEASQQGREEGGGGEAPPPHPPAYCHSCPAPRSVSE